MSIQTEISRLDGIKTTLQNDKTSIANAIEAKGVTVTGHGFGDFAADIATIPQKYATGTVTFDANSREFAVSNLSFQPTFVAIRVNKMPTWSSSDTALTEVFMDFSLTKTSSSPPERQLYGVGVQSGATTQIAAKAPSAALDFNADSNGFHLRNLSLNGSDIYFIANNNNPSTPQDFDLYYRWIAIG